MTPETLIMLPSTVSDSNHAEDLCWEAKEAVQWSQEEGSVAVLQGWCRLMHQKFPTFLWCRVMWPYNNRKTGGNREHWCPECEGPEDPHTPRQFKAGVPIRERMLRHKLAKR